MDAIVNKVAESGLITLNLEDYLPAQESVAVFDLKPFLFREMILREKDIREALPLQDWQEFQGKHVAVTCSADAIIPMWAFMLVGTYLSDVAASIFSGTAVQLNEHLLLKNIDAINAEDFLEKRVVVKGCGDNPLPEAAFLAIAVRLKPVVKSLMYGEPCSTVPVFKKKKTV